MEFKHQITNEKLFNSKVVDVELDLVKNQGCFKGDVTLELENGSRTFWGEHGSRDYEVEFGFIITYAYTEDYQSEHNFKAGDRVEAEGYIGVLVLNKVDEMTTSMTNKIHWLTTSEDYLEGRAKVNNGEVYSEDELKFTPGKNNY